MSYKGLVFRPEDLEVRLLVNRLSNLFRLRLTYDIIVAPQVNMRDLDNHLVAQRY